MTIVNFEEVSVRGTKKGKCGCGKTRSRAKTFTNTLNPWNKNESGEVRTYAEVLENVCKERAEWLKEPVTCEECRPLTKWEQKRKAENEFLRESNAIEGVYDDASLQQAKYAWAYLKGQSEITIAVVLKVHKILMLYQPLMPDQKGYFRQCEVTIGGRYGEPWLNVPKKMGQWIKYANAPATPHAESFIKVSHIDYENIHPFVDGNGRTGRLFMNWQRRKCGLPLLIIHEGAEQLEYYKWFRE